MTGVQTCALPISEIKLGEKQRLVEEAAAALAKLTVRASEPGDRSEPAEWLAREPVGESEGRRPSE